MSATVESVLSIAMTLSTPEQKELVERLWETVGADDEVFNEATWKEIGRRVLASDNGETTHLSGDQVLSEIRQRVGEMSDT